MRSGLAGWLTATLSPFRNFGPGPILGLVLWGPSLTLVLFYNKGFYLGYFKDGEQKSDKILDLVNLFEKAKMRSTLPVIGLPKERTPPLVCTTTVCSASSLANLFLGSSMEKNGRAGSKPKITATFDLVFFPAIPAACAPKEWPIKLIFFELDKRP